MEKKKEYKLTEEHRKKIGEANSIANKGKHNSPKTEFKKGRISEMKGKQFPQIQGSNHYRWVGGTRATARRIAERYGFNLTKCSACGVKDRTVVHHVDENMHNNELKNLRVLCFRCHNLLHGYGMETRFKKGHKVSKETRIKLSKKNTKHGRYAKYN